jgi:hypothetical protein
LRTEAIPELRLLMEFGAFRDNRAVVCPIQKWTLAAIEARRGTAIGCYDSGTAMIGQYLQSDGMSVSQDWQARLTDVEYIGSSAGNADVTQEGERRP